MDKVYYDQYSYIANPLQDQINFNEMCEKEYLKTFKKLVNDPLIRKIIKKCRKFADMQKEVKKMRPYLEVKVVKVKKEKHKQHYCPCCGGKIEMEKPKGNWVNGENLDKIKFPCFCSFVWCGVKIYGMLYEMADEYILINTNSQYKYKLTSISNKTENKIRNIKIGGTD